MKKKISRIKESIKMMNNQTSDTEKINLTEQGKKIGTDEVIKRKENHNYKIKPYCLKCRKDTENINPSVPSTSNYETMILSKCTICGSKNQNTL